MHHPRAPIWCIVHHPQSIRPDNDGSGKATDAPPAPGRIGRQRPDAATPRLGPERVQPKRPHQPYSSITLNCLRSTFVHANSVHPPQFSSDRKTQDARCNTQYAIRNTHDTRMPTVTQQAETINRPHLPPNTLPPNTLLTKPKGQHPQQSPDFNLMERPKSHQGPSTNPGPPSNPSANARI
jgi:hypothetical protein